MPGQLHARREVLELHDAAAEDGRRQVVARIECGTSERGENVLQQMRADAQLRGELMDIDRGRALGDDAAGRSGWLGAAGSGRLMRFRG